MEVNEVNTNLKIVLIFYFAEFSGMKSRGNQMKYGKPVRCVITPTSYLGYFVCFIWTRFTTDREDTKCPADEVGYYTKHYLHSCYRTFKKNRIFAHFQKISTEQVMSSRQIFYQHSIRVCFIKLATHSQNLGSSNKLIFWQIPQKARYE